MTANDIANMVEKEPYHTNLNRIAIAHFVRQQQAEIEALKANRKHDFGLGEASGFIKGHKENPYQSITNTKIEPTVVSYTHPAKELPTKEDEYWLMVEVLRAKVKEQQAEIEALKDMLEEEGIGVSQKYLDERIAELRKAQEK